MSRVAWDGNFEFLGAPIGSAEYCGAFTSERVAQAKVTLDAVAKLTDPQVGLRLLRHCAGFCKMVYSMRVTDPEAHSAALLAFDELQRATFTEITGLRPNDAQWGQAQRGFTHSGLGLRSVARHAPGAYLASCAATQAQCLAADAGFVCDVDTPQSAPARALVALNGMLPGGSPVTMENMAKLRQKDISTMIDKVAHEDFFNSASVSDRATLLSESLPGASGFLSAAPSKEFGLAMEPSEFVTEVARRLLMPVFPADRFCPFCDCVLDRKGGHALTCSCAGDRVARHNSTRNLVGRFAQAAGLNPTLERPHLLPPRPDDPYGANLRRPADVYLPAWDNGAPAAFDLAITSPQRQDVLAQAANTVGSAAASYEITKIQHLNTAAECQRQGVLFVPVVAETSGGWGLSGMQVLRRIAKSTAHLTGQDPDLVLGQHLQVLCVAIRSANARAVLRRGCEPEGVGGNAQAAAASVLEAFRS